MEYIGTIGEFDFSNKKDPVIESHMRITSNDLDYVRKACELVITDLALSHSYIIIDQAGNRY